MPAMEDKQTPMDSADHVAWTDYYDALTADRPVMEEGPQAPTTRRRDRARTRAIARGALIPWGGAMPEQAPEPTPDPTDEAEAAAAKAAQDAARELRTALLGGEDWPDMIRVGTDDTHHVGAAKVVQRHVVVRFAFEASGLTVDLWNMLPEDDRSAKVAAMVEELKAHNGERAPVDDDHPEGIIPNTAKGAD